MPSMMPTSISTTPIISRLVSAESADLPLCFFPFREAEAGRCSLRPAEPRPERLFAPFEPVAAIYLNPFRVICAFECLRFEPVFYYNAFAAELKSRFLKKAVIEKSLSRARETKPYSREIKLIRGTIIKKQGPPACLRAVPVGRLSSIQPNRFGRVKVMRSLPCGGSLRHR